MIVFIFVDWKNIVSEKKIIVVCEGQTEKIYLAGWAAACGVRHRVEIINSSLTSPIDLLEEGVKEYLWAQASGDDCYSDVWIVFDRDGHESFHRALEASRKYPYVHMCWTNPCIEAWFLMHFKPLPKFARDKWMLLSSVDTPIGNGTTLMRREEVWEKIVDPKTVLNALKSVWSNYGKTNVGIFETLKTKMDFAIGQCVGTSIREDVQKFGSLMPEVLCAIARLGTQTDEQAEMKVSPVFHAICCQRRAQAQLADYVARHIADKERCAA